MMTLPGSKKVRWLIALAVVLVLVMLAIQSKRSGRTSSSAPGDTTCIASRLGLPCGPT